MESSSRETRITFHEELDELEGSVQSEALLVVRSVQAATRALVEQDLELADEVIAFDDDVDAGYFAIQAGVESLLARQTPEKLAAIQSAIETAVSRYAKNEGFAIPKAAYIVAVTKIKPA